MAISGQRVYGDGGPRRAQDSRIRSQTPADYFDTLAEYRKTKSENRSSNAPLLEIIRSRDEHLARLRQGVTPLGGARSSDGPIGSPSSAYPWLSLVLGSGALPGPDVDGVPTVDIRGLVADGLRGLEGSGNEPDPMSEHALPELAEEFLAGLTSAKLGLDSAVSALPVNVLTDNTAARVLAVRAAVIAAMSTRLYAEALTRTRVLMSPDREILHVDREDPQAQQLLREVAKPLVDFIERALPRTNAVRSRSVTAFVLLAQQVSSGISGVRTVEIDRSHVELLSAFAWYFLTEDTAIYPGWSDILLFQAADMVETHERLVDNPSLRRPYLRNIGMPNEISWITSRLERVTRKSWERTATAPDEIYSAAADIVLQQAAARSSFMKDGNDQLVNLPLATAFIASFDVELEMALWRRIIDAKRAEVGSRGIDSFAVIAPFFATEAHVGAGASVLNTSFLWGYRFVTPAGSTVEDFLSTMKKEEEEERSVWRKLSKQSRKQLSRLPIIVHLSGAPLLSEANARSLELADKTRVHHAILLDEYRALVEMATGFTGGQAAAWGELVQSSSLLDLIGERFWLFIGAQLADPGVRLRLLAQEMISLFHAGGGADDSTMRHGDADARFARGLMVNDWSPASERAAFTWQAIDVVKGRASELIDDLRGIREDVARMLESGGESR